MICNPYKFAELRYTSIFHLMNLKEDGMIMGISGQNLWKRGKERRREE
jgi:hypothetical protein